MTVELFIILLVSLSVVSTLLTEAIKKATEKKFSSNLIAFIVSAIVGGGGSIMSFVWMNIPFTIGNICTIPCMILAIWIGAQVGYDKVIQTIKQVFNK